MNNESQNPLEAINKKTSITINMFQEDIENIDIKITGSGEIGSFEIFNALLELTRLASDGEDEKVAPLLDAIRLQLSEK